MKKKRIIAIDPDCELSGVGVYDNGKVMLMRKPYDDIVEMLKAEPMETTIVVEGGWLNRKTNFHYNGSRRGVAEKVAYSVGRNHQVGMMLVEWCRNNGKKLEIQKPFTKCWKGSDGKITHEELEGICGELYNAQGNVIKRSNQDERDAALIAWIVAGEALKL